MDTLAVIGAGLLATAVLTLLMYGGPLVGLPQMDMIGMKGTMLTSNKKVAYTVGTLSHFVMGIILAVIYVWFWSVGYGKPTWGWGLLYGFLVAVTYGDLVSGL